MATIPLYKHLANILRPVRGKVSVTQLLDGTVYIYDTKKLIGSFKYYGGNRLYNVRLNTRQYINKDISKSIYKLNDDTMPHGPALAVILKEILPNASECNPQFKHAYEFSILESCIQDTTTQFEISRINKNGFDVAMINVDGFVSSSFRFLYSGKLKYIFIRYNSRQKDIKLPLIYIPPNRMQLFLDLLTRELLPIAD